MDLPLKKLEITSGHHFNLKDFDTSSGEKLPVPEELKKLLAEDITAISKLQNRLYAENRQALLIIMQGMDAAGKDSAIKHIMTGVNPQGVDVVSFKHPSDEELDHDYLWRHYIKLPAHGKITIFNRSHYENVLITRVHPNLITAEKLPGIRGPRDIRPQFWQTRFRQINDFERTVTENGTTILKLFFHLSRKEQRKRFLERIENPEKHWKFSSADLKERGFWKEYHHAYEAAIKHTSTKRAPWFIIPSDDKWYAHLLIGKIIFRALQKMNPAYPALDQQEELRITRAKKILDKGTG
ncbi:MAG TPA: PPK2 family polyphosphate kinase [Chitinophagaceae bacterium]|nr:PPK2 family polyphosphate kinase [Chitinophagaceae bacterium]